MKDLYYHFFGFIDQPDLFSNIDQLNEVHRLRSEIYEIRKTDFAIYCTDTTDITYR